MKTLRAKYIKGKGYEMAVKKKIWERDNYICHYCGKEMKQLYELWKKGKIKRKTALLTADHVIPKALGGLWEENNLVTACLICNNKKADKIIIN